MIPVPPAPEPDDFGDKVRKRGLAAIAELTGTPAPKRRGPKRAPRYASAADIPPERLPDYWTRALDDLAERYHNLCAYTALYLRPGTANRTVDHWIPKSADWRQAYEWTNFRLAAGLVNAYKGTRTGLVDPFTIKAGWFALDLLSFKVVVGPKSPPARVSAIQATIGKDGLHLNLEDFRRAREKNAQDYWNGVPLWHLKEHSPFVASELQRQGWLRHDDRAGRAAQVTA